MNKSDLVEAVSESCGLDKRSAEQAVTTVIDLVIGETRAGSKVQIFGFGTFTPTARSARTGRNPQTGAPVKIAASKSVRFAPSTAFKQALNKGGAKKAAARKTAPAKSGPAKSASARSSARKPSTTKTKATAKKTASSRKR